jgi:hypothetical protein
MEIFERYGAQALAVNPSSPRNLNGQGTPTDHDNPKFHHKEDWTEEEYDAMVEEVGKGYVIDGICTWCTIFNREKLDKVAGILPGRAWFDEIYFSGGEDYDLNRRGYLTLNNDNEHRGYRMLGAGNSFVWHWWCETKSNLKETDFGMNAYQVFTKSSKIFKQKWGADADVWGKLGNKLIPMNIVQDL